MSKGTPQAPAAAAKAPKPASKAPEKRAAPTHEPGHADLADSAGGHALMKDLEQSIDKPMVDPNSREDKIREAAYLRYLARGAEGGDPESDWLAAEEAHDAGR